MTFENIILEAHGKVTVIRLNRPQAMNALSPDLTKELAQALDQLEADPHTAVVVLTGNEKAFAAGADIKAMKNWSYMDVYTKDFITVHWERITAFRKPTIAAVS